MIRLQISRGYTRDLTAQRMATATSGVLRTLLESVLDGSDLYSRDVRDVIKRVKSLNHG